MLPLFDLMMKAQNGSAVEAFAKQFGLAHEQMNQAVAALMPAFSSGFKRTTSDPYDFTALLTAISSGNYAKYFEDVSKAFSPQGVADGNTILAQIFGSKEVSRAIAAQAEQMSGIGQDILKQMMPAMANAMVGGFFKQLAGQFQKAGEAFSAPGAGNDFFSQWMKATGMGDQSKAGAGNTFNNPFLQAMQSMFPGQPQQVETGGDPASNPFLALFQAFAGSPQEERPKAAAAESGHDTAAAMTQLFNQMFDSGLEVQKSYQKNVDSIIEGYMKNFGAQSSGKPE